MEDLKIISQNYQEAVDYIDDKIARQTIKDINLLFQKQNIQQSNPTLFQKLQKALIYLRIVAFSTLPDEESCEILRSSVLEFFEIDVPLERQLSAKLFSVPEVPRDDLRKKLNASLSANQQKIGNFSIGQWIQEFEKAFDKKTRDDSALITFFSDNPFAQKLESKEKLILKKILHAYDFFLVFTLPATGENLKNILEDLAKNPPKFDSNQASAPLIPQLDNSPIKEASKFQAKSQTKNYQENLIQMNIGEILLDYPEAGEQLISPAKIKIKGFPDFVRPSIKNWLADYALSLENDRGSLLTRNNYLFKNPNASYLDQESRSNLDAILKSFDEKTSLSIDTANKVIVFQKAENISRKENQNINRKEEHKESNISNPQFFSSQKLPFERNRDSQQNPQPLKVSSPQPIKQNMTDSSNTAPATKQIQPEKTPQNDSQLFRIVPLGKNSQNKSIDAKNLPVGGTKVINLKDLM